MGIIILGSIILPIIVVSIIVFIFLNRNSKKSETQYQKHRKVGKRQESAQGGRAVVINVCAGTTEVAATELRVYLTFDVTPYGEKTYRASATWLVDISALGFIKQGKEIPVKIDNDDPKIIYPNSTWATYVYT